MDRAVANSLAEADRRRRCYSLPVNFVLRAGPGLMTLLLAVTARFHT
jgi:hypothetical protein